MTTAVVDCDLLMFKAAAAGEQRVIDVTVKKTGKKMEFANRTEFKKLLKEKPQLSIDMFDIVDIQRPPPLEKCFKTMRDMLKSIKEVVKADKMELYLGKGDSFRKAFDLPRMYKDDRDKLIKPVHLADVRQFLINTLKAIEVEFIEADDFLSMRTYEGYLKYRETGKDEDKVVQVTSDKDGRQCSGWLYNHDNMTEPMWIEGYGELYREPKGKVNGHGRAWLYFQSLAGDPVDTYKPSILTGKEFGDVSAYDLLKDCGDDREALRVLADTYKSWYPEPITYKTWDDREVTKDWVDLANMYFNTARMLRWKDDEVDLRKVLQTHGILPMGQKKKTT